MTLLRVGCMFFGQRCNFKQYELHKFWKKRKVAELEIKKVMGIKAVKVRLASKKCI